jgi:DNA-directed RNA polymerase subunit RPC12/RpoP
VKGFFAISFSSFNLRYFKGHWKHLKAKYFSFVEGNNSMEKTGIIYECLRCGAKVPSEELDLRGGEIKCIICGYRILKKVKPPVVKRVQAK